ncbi:hypothetical protein RHMOL_Rhmol04G0343000 [Rhododendron molle]|uniref:Uncharacterized protein n=1 Tax=Rhododendron molle TaxID=49168 RepID=A0ACC0P9S7_RHOML|nr:hypothetical protein RHMOL_Rhmol04G0343000 [Rhododendron molle]
MAVVCFPLQVMALVLFMCLISSKLSSWKCIGDFDYPCCLCGPGSVVNGAPHWFGHGITDIDVRYFLIVCFDVMEEKFKEVPTSTHDVESYFFKVDVLDGCLCAVDSRLEGHINVWVMKEYGVKESWTKLFVVPNVPLNVAGEFFFHYFDLLCLTKDGEAVLRLMLEASVKLAIYNPKHKTYKRIGIPQDWEWFDVSLCVESLVSPHGCKKAVLEGTANQMEMEEKVVTQLIPISCFSLFTHFAYVVCNWCVNTLLSVNARAPSPSG